MRVRVRWGQLVRGQFAAVCCRGPQIEHLNFTPYSFLQQASILEKVKGTTKQVELLRRYLLARKLVSPCAAITLWRL